MSLKDIWKNKTDGVDDVLAKDINAIAEQTIKNEEFIKDKAETSDNKVTEITDEPTNEKEYPTTEAIKKYLNEKVKQSDHNQNDSTQPDYIKNRLAYEGTELLETSCDFIVDTVVVKLLSGEFVDGEHLLFEITKDGETHQDEIEILGKTVDGVCIFKSGWAYGWDFNTIVFPEWDATSVSAKVYRPTVKKMDSKFIPDGVVKELPIGTVFRNGYISYDGATRFYVLQKGDYYVNTKCKLYISEPCICMLSFNEDSGSVYITTISPNCVRTLSIWAMGEGNHTMEEGSFFPLDSFELRNMLQNPVKTVFEQLWLMAPDGLPYKVSVDDDGTLTTEPIGEGMHNE